MVVASAVAILALSCPLDATHTSTSAVRPDPPANAAAATTTNPVGDRPPVDALALSLAALAVAERGAISVDERDAPLDEALERFRLATGIALRAEWDALARLSVDRDARIDWQARDVPPLVALRALALSLGTDLDRPVIDASQGSLVLTSLQALSAHRETAIYDVADIAADPTLIDSLASLIAADPEEDEETTTPIDPTTLTDDRRAGERVDRLARLLMDHIDPEGWMDFGGTRGRISSEAGRLLVTASPATHRELRRLLGILRSESPVGGEVRLSLVELPARTARSVLDQLAQTPMARRRALVDDALQGPYARRLASTRLIVRLDQEARIETRTEESPNAASSDPDLSATITLRHDRARRALLLDLDVTASLAKGRWTLDTAIDFPLPLEARAARPEIVDAIALSSPPAETAGADSIWLLVVEIAPRMRDGG